VHTFQDSEQIVDEEGGETLNAPKY